MHIVRREAAPASASGHPPLGSGHPRKYLAFSVESAGSGQGLPSSPRQL